MDMKDIQNYLFSYFAMPFNSEISLEDIVKQIEEENERQKKDLIKYEKEINELKSSHKN